MFQISNIQKEEQIINPPMHYPLECILSSAMPGNFYRLTMSGCFPTDEAKCEANAFLQRVSNSSVKTWTFGYIPAPPQSEITRRVIGKNGYYFKMTTTLSEVGFIWHNRVTNKFLFWGPSSYKVVKAMNAIRWRIHKIYSTPPSRIDSHYKIENIYDHEKKEEKSVIDKELLLLLSEASSTTHVAQCF